LKIDLTFIVHWTPS